MIARSSLPAYLALCLVLGGASSAGAIANAILQILGLILILWAFWAPDREMTRPASQFSALLIAFVALAFFQLAPIPETLWLASAGRAELADEGAVAGVKYWPPLLTLQPHASILSLVGSIPAIAIASVMLLKRGWKAADLAIILVIGMLASMTIGAIQISQGAASTLYFYQITNKGSTVGFFANRNHLGTLLLVSLPFITALAVHYQRRRRLAHLPILIGAMSIVAVVITGILVNGSRFALIALLPTLIACTLIYWRSPWMLVASIRLFPIGIALAAAWLFFSDAGANFLKLETEGLTGSREYIWSKTREAIEDFWLLGSGIGTFSLVVRRYEDGSLITSEYINQAHNEYLQVMLEFGIFALPLIICSLIWWGINARLCWKSKEVQPFARAGVVASCIILIHSFVDYPLRTPALSGIFIVSLIMMITGSEQIRREQGSEKN
ncbi:MAG: O-antigen ligase family protein [Erythrobacter sp.]